MTSQKYFCNLRGVFENVKQNKYIIILHTILLFLVTTLPAIILHSSWMEEIARGMADAQSSLNYPRDIAASLAGATGFMTILVAAAGIIIAIVQFAYLFNMRSVVFYHAQPYKRSSIFLTRVTAGFFTVLIPLAIIFVVNLITYLAFDLGDAMPMLDMVKIYLFILLAYMFMFSVGTLAATLSGNVFAQLMATAFLFLVYPLTLAILQGNLSAWYTTYVWNPPFFDIENFLPPFLLAKIQFNGIGALNWQFVLYCIIATLLLLGLSMWVSIKRKSENTNKFFAFNGIAVFLKYYITTVLSLGFGLIFVAASNNSIAISYLGYLLVALILYAVLQAIFAKNFRSMFAHMGRFAVFAVLFAAVLAFPIFDIGNFDAKAPAANVSKLEISKIDLSSVQSGAPNAVLKDPANIKAAVQFLEKVAAYNEDISLGEQENSPYYGIEVSTDRYEVFNLSRRFRFAKKEDVDAFLQAVYDTPEYKAALGEMPDIESIESISCYKNPLASAHENIIDPTFPKAKIQTLLSTLQAEIAQYSYADILASRPAVRIEIGCLTGEDQHYTQNVYTVYSCYQNTLLALDEMYHFSDWDYSFISSVNIIKESGYDAYLAGGYTDPNGVYTKITDRAAVDAVCRAVPALTGYIPEESRYVLEFLGSAGTTHTSITVALEDLPQDVQQAVLQGA